MTPSWGPHDPVVPGQAKGKDVLQKGEETGILDHPIGIGDIKSMMFYHS